MRAIQELEKTGYVFWLEGEKIQFKYQGAGKPAPDQVKPLFEELKQQKREAINYLQAEDNKVMEQYFDRKFKEMLQEVTAPDLDDGYLDFPDDANQAAIAAVERKLGASWARGLAGDESAVADFDKALEELRLAFLKSIEDYKRRQHD